MKNKNYDIGDLIMHPKKKQGCQYAIVVKNNSGLCKWDLDVGFGIKWFEKPDKTYWFSAHEWYETEKGFRLIAKGKQ